MPAAVRGIDWPIAAVVGALLRSSTILILISHSQVASPSSAAASGGGVGGGGFLPFLPQDNKQLADSSEKAVAVISNDLGGLLRLGASDFWAVVRSDRSLHACLDTYLHYKRCGPSLALS
jgi:hypothetical protein